MAARYGLVARIHREAGGATVLDITGPLALFHATTVYGRAIAQLIPLLADHERFELDIACEFDGLAETLRVTPPIRLPPVVARRRAPTTADRLATDLVAAGRGVEREPPPIVAGAELVFPDLAVTPLGMGGDAHVGADRDADRWLIEVVGFSTAAYLASKQAAYREAGIERAILCVDADRAAPDEVGTSPPARASPRIVWFLRRIEVAAVLEAITA